MISSDSQAPVQERLDRRALARALTRAANAGVEEVIATGLASPASSMRRIAFTGPPGAGKSTLTGLFAKARLAAHPESRIAILAIDPTSPYSGGALLGDRIRIDALVEDSRLYVRSLASRNGAEGLADNIGLIFATLERFGFDEAVIETVGVGQTDTAVRELADLVVLVTNPESGDTVQAMKSGIMEAADIYVVNKADLPGASQAAFYLRSGLNGKGRGGSKPAILETSQTDPTSVERLSQAVDEHFAAQKGARDGQTVQAGRVSQMVGNLVRRRSAEVLAEMPHYGPARTLERLSDTFAEMSRQLRHSGTGRSEAAE